MTTELKNRNEVLLAKSRERIRDLEETLRRTHIAAEEFRKGFQMEFKRELLTLVTAAFGLTAALFWNTAIKDTVNHFIPSAENWYWEIAIAIVVTLVAVFFIYLLSRITEVKKEIKVEKP